MTAVEDGVNAAYDFIKVSAISAFTENRGRCSDDCAVSRHGKYSKRVIVRPSDRRCLAADAGRVPWFRLIRRWRDG